MSCVLEGLISIGTSIVVQGEERDKGGNGSAAELCKGAGAGYAGCNVLHHQAALPRSGAVAVAASTARCGRWRRCQPTAAACPGSGGGRTYQPHRQRPSHALEVRNLASGLVTILVFQTTPR